MLSQVVKKSIYISCKTSHLCKKAKFVKDTDGDWVVDWFCWYHERNKNPFITIATGDYLDLVAEIGKDDALATIISSLIHEITHYFQWLNDYPYCVDRLQNQAKRTTDKIMDAYSEARTSLQRAETFDIKSSV